MNNLPKMPAVNKPALILGAAGLIGFVFVDSFRFTGKYYLYNFIF